MQRWCGRRRLRRVDELDDQVDMLHMGELGGVLLLHESRKSKGKCGVVGELGCPRRRCQVSPPVMVRAACVGGVEPWNG
jgi:hypothetical protein